MPEEIANEGSTRLVDSAASAKQPVPFYSWYVLALLLVVGVLNFIDRQAMFVLAEAVKRDLGLSDTEVGLITGFAFAVVYAAGGILIARVADRTSRRTVLGVGIVVWSAMTALGGFAQTFVQLAISRFGVAAGEAAATPTSHGLISEHFPESRRGLAISVVSLGGPVGTMLGFAGGGWLVSHYDWRTVLMILGLPGIAIGLLVLLTVRDHGAGSSPESLAPPGKGAVIRLLRLPAFVTGIVAFMFTAVAGYGFATFQVPFFIRVHEMDPAQAGLFVGILHGIVGGAGMITGGYLSDKLGQRDVRWKMWVPSIGLTLAGIMMTAGILAEDGTAALWLMVVPSFLATFYLAPVYNMGQSLASPDARSTASAILLCAAGLIGGGGGPLLVGMTSDALTPAYGIEGIRYALLWWLPLNLLAAFFYYLSGRALPADLAKPKA